PTPRAEWRRYVNGAVGVQPPAVLAAPLPGRDFACAPVASQRLALLEVDVDGVVPITAVVSQVPDLACTEAGRRRYPAEVGGESLSPIRLDTPRTTEARHRVVGRLVGAVAEREVPLTRDRDFRQVWVRDHDGRHLAYIRARRIADDPELQEFADARIGGVARQRFGQRPIIGNPPAVLVLGEVYHPDLLPDAVAREVDHNVVALGNAQLVQLGEHHRTRQQVPVVGDLNHRRAVRQRDLEKARHARVEDAEAVLAPLHL